VSGQELNRIRVLLLVAIFLIGLTTLFSVGSFMEDRNLNSKEEQIANLQIKNDNLRYQLTMCRMLVGK
jgi:hypothetical protein